MPKIPTFTSEARPTAQAASVVSNIKIGLNQTVGAALAPLGKAAEDYYVKEKKLEADNKAYALLSDMYIDQKDANGNIVQKGLFTIQSETKNNGEPTNAAAYNDQEVNKLYQYFKNNKFDGVDNFTKKAIESKYFSTAGILKTKSLEGSRNTQITDSTKIDEDYISKEAIVLKDVGPVYFEIYNKKVIDKITANSNYDNGQKKILIEAYEKFGAATLAESMVNNQPMLFKQALEKGQFDILNPEEKNKLIATADANILESKFGALTSSLNLAPDAPADLLTKAYDEISKGTFGGNKDLQNLYKNLSSSEKTEFSDFYNKKARSLKNDMQFNMLASNQIFKMEAAGETKKVIEDMEKSQGIYNQKIESLFGKTPAIVEQFQLLNEKVINSNGISISNFDNNSKIIDLILNDEINLVTDKFILPGESGESKSIVERYESGVNLADIKFLSNILDTQNKNPEFKSTLQPFFNFINDFKTPVQGSPALQFIDDGFDKRLNNFKYSMYQRFINGIEQGMSAKSLVDPGDKNFIGKDILSFMPKSNEIFTDIIKKIKKEKMFDDKIKPPQKSELEKIYGALTFEQYKNTVEYKNWLEQNKN
jgi:D-Tyr-tRNAtyr deacylase